MVQVEPPLRRRPKGLAMHRSQFPHPVRHPVRHRAAIAAGLSALTFTVVACGDGGGSGSAGQSTTTAAEVAAAPPVIDPGDGGEYRPAVDPANFVDVIDNPYLPFLPGSRWVYEGDSDGETERIEVVVTDERRLIMGISAVVVRDTVEVDGELVEDTFDWFAQDRDGNVWYLGEDSREIVDGEVVNADGSWEAGVDGALPGIVMPADPTPGAAYRQEFYAGEAEDMGEVLRIEGTASIALGQYSDVVVTEDWTPLEPAVVEEKWYAPGVGKIYETHTAGSSGTVELVDYTPGS